MQRKIWLTNKDNTDTLEFDSNAFGSMIFTAPTKFGIYREKDYITVNNQRITIKDEPVFEKITGIIIIRGLYSELEAKYSILRDFISKYIKEGFRLYVQTQENVQARYINCDIESLDKSEKTSGAISVPITIQPKTLWLGDVSGASISQAISVEGQFKFTEQTIGGNTVYATKFALRSFDDEYGNDVYSIALASSQVSTAFIFNSGEETTPLLIRIYGPATNPYIKLKDYESGEVVQSVKFTGLTITSDYYIEINSNPENNYIERVKISDNERSDVEDFADQDKTIFITLPTGRYNIETSDDVVAHTLDTRIFFTNQYKGA